MRPVSPLGLADELHAVATAFERAVLPVDLVMRVDTVVIGAGIVGLSVAREIARSGREVLVAERGGHIGSETSSRNSEVLHSGIYYPHNSLKARLCVVGRELLAAYCASRDIPHRWTGKLVLAVSRAEVSALDGYETLGLANGVVGLRRLGPAEVRALEPNVTCVAALYSPASGIVDSHSLMTSLWGDLQAAGGEVVFHSEVESGMRTADGFELCVAGESIACGRLVNCAGLAAPAIASRLAGCADRHTPRPYFARGHYFSLSGPAPFRRLVYPIAEAAGLGIHATLDLAGKVRFGPDIEWCAKADYSFDAGRRDQFVAAIRKYYPALEPDQLQPDYVGVRPKIVGPGEAAADFRIDGPSSHGVPGLVHLYGIESPGLTACLAIGKRVYDLLNDDG